MNLEKLVSNLSNLGYAVNVFDDVDSANSYILNNVKDTTVGIGGSMTIKEMGIVMKEAKAKIGPAADGKTINEVVKEKFTMANGLMSQTAKMKRNTIFEKYKNLISNMFDKK